MYVAVAGTFGPLHDGHRELFRQAIRFGDRVVVALTTDGFAPETRSEPRPIPSYDERERAVRAAFDELVPDSREVAVEVRPLESELGIASEEPALDALVVSPETAPELEEINDARRGAGLDPIVGIVAPYVLAADGERISSTRIVRGEIDESGDPVG
jgi:pantetheine-phosphate adenylyltransferase